VLILFLIVGALIFGSVDHGAPHIMPPTAVAVTLLLALVIDFSSFGPNSLRDRVAFCMACPAIREGFDGSPLDQWTVQKLHQLIEALLHSPPVDGSRLAGASVNLLIGAVIGLTWLYAILCLLPAKLSKRLGRAATLTWPTSPLGRLNLPLWGVAIVLGLMADLPGGAIGMACRASIDILIAPITAVVAWMFGAV
jgi:hypothetical protein